jgi:hypothetical protein
VDNTRGEPAFWLREEVRSSKLTLTVQETTRDHIQLTLEGRVVLATQPDLARADRGYDVHLAGELSYDLRQKTWTRFDVTAVGDHWGESPSSPGARASRTPLGIVFELGRGDTAADLAPPAGMRDAKDHLPP